MNDPHRPVCPTGVVPSRLTSDQPTLLQPWTAEEQRELHKARATVERLLARQNAAHQKAFDALVLVLPLAQLPLMRQLVENADAVRDILKPFDSGVRGASGV